MSVSPPESMSDRARTLWTRARERAALIGPFNPLDLVGTLQDRAVREALAALSNECVEVLGEQRARWQLSADVRRHVLSSLYLEGRLIEAADNAPQRDIFARYLRTALHGTFAVAPKASLEQLEVARSAAHFAAPFGTSRAIEWSLDAAVATRNAVATRKWVARRPLIGREAQHRRLRSFVQGYGSEPWAGANPWSLVITGASGSGKSALLAEYARRHASTHGDGFPILWLDFDRAALAAPSPMILLVEFARQLGLAVPAARNAIDAFLENIQHFDDSADQPSESFSLESSRTTSMWSLWHGHVEESWAAKPVLLVLDTLEEVLIHRDGRAEQLASWLRALVFESGLHNVRVLLAGRGDGGQLQMLFGTGNPPLNLRDLHSRSAERLLKRDLADGGLVAGDVPSRALVEHYGGNPLTLKMMARYLAARGPEAGHELLEDAGQERFASEMSQSLLYRRILGRIRSSDADLVKVAHPGLVLRRVTPGLIMDVLAGPCGLGPIDEARAQTLFDALSEQIWLVDAAAEPDAVRHRRDLRRLVFAAMNASRPDCAQAIHRAALAYYTKGRDLHLSPREQATEAAYHRAFVEPASLDDASLRELAASLGEDSADLPASLRARLKLLSGRGLTSSEFESLGSKERSDIEASNARSAIRRTAGATGTPMTVSSAPHVPGLAAERAYAAGDLDTLLELGTALVDEFFEELLSERRDLRSPLPDDFTSFGLWRAAMVARRRREADWMLRALNERIQSRRIEWSAPLNRSTKQWFSRGEAVNALLLLLGSDGNDAVEFRVPQSQSRPEISSTQELRLTQLTAQTGQRSRAHFYQARVSVNLLRILEPMWLEQLARPTEHAPLLELHPVTTDLLTRMRDSARTLLPSLADITITNARQSFVDVMAESFSRPEIARCLRGITPEIHQLVHVAARKAPLDGIFAFAATAQRRFALWPRELTTDALTKALRVDRERWIGTLIEVADRCGGLPLLLDTLREHSIDSVLVRRVAAVLEDYDHALVGTGNLE